jgi:hypothetical protein
VFARFQNTASFSFDEHNPVMLDAVVGITKAGPNGHCVVKCKRVEELLKNIFRADFDIVIKK